MRNPELVSLGYLCLDTNITPQRTQQSIGGGAYFAAQAASKYTDSIGVVSRVGTDFPLLSLRPNILQEGIQRSARPSMHVRLEYTGKDLADRSITVDWNAAQELSVHDIPLLWWQSLQWCLVSTMEPVQQGQILQSLKQRSPQTFIALDSSEFLLEDSRSRAQVLENYKAADLIFTNRHEFAYVQPFVDQLPKVIHKMDKDGARYLEYGQERVRVGSPQVKAVDTTGAGDILAGTFLALCSTGLPFSLALEEAVKTASQAVSQQGIDHLFDENGSR